MAPSIHIPVLLRETVDSLAIRQGGTYVDGTLGRAGHAREILCRAGAGATLVGIDRDPVALEECASLAGEFPSARIELVHACHGDVAATVRGKGVGEVDGILFDLGVSSPQLDEPGRGFSFRADGPLDMRMDPSRGVTAADLVETATPEELERVLRELGEEPMARRIARAIAGRRFSTTSALAAAVEQVVPRHGPHHPATRAFQALRMAVNDETGELAKALDGALGLLRPGGRLAVITFESITDRMVKLFFAAHAGRMVSLQQGGEVWVGKTPRVRPVNRRVITAAEDELAENPRSRSAKLRTVERI